MTIAVLAKQVPDGDVVTMDEETRRVVRDGKTVLDEASAHAVELALRLADGAASGEVVLISMGPAGEVAGLRTALAMGASRAILVSDPSLVGADALVTAKVLAAAVYTTAAELVVAGTESSDGYTGTVPVQVAELLGYPAITCATQVDLQSGLVRAARQTDSGVEDLECSLPAVLSVTGGVVEVRYPSFKGVIGARTKPIEEWDLAELRARAPMPLDAHIQQEVLRIEHKGTRLAGEIIVDDGSAHEVIVERFRDWKVM